MTDVQFYRSSYVEVVLQELLFCHRRYIISVGRGTQDDQVKSTSSVRLTRKFSWVDQNNEYTNLKIMQG